VVDPWTIGLTLVIIVGLGAIIYGALADRRKNRRAVAEMLAPPNRVIPRLKSDAKPPSYLSDLQGHRPPSDAESTNLSPQERQEIKEQLDQPGVTKINAGYASDYFVTDRASSWAVLDHPRVLLCEDHVNTIRELLPVFEKVILANSPLVVVASHLDPDVVRTLEVNQVQQTMKVLAVHNVASTDLPLVETGCHATPVSRDDRQSGYVTVDKLGQCDRWVSTKKASYLVAHQPSISGPVEQR
jgi:hypothetical protein